MSKIGAQVLQEQDDNYDYAPMGRIEGLVGMTDEDLQEFFKEHGFASSEAWTNYWQDQDDISEAARGQY